MKQALKNIIMLLTLKQVRSRALDLSKTPVLKRSLIERNLLSVLAILIGILFGAIFFAGNLHEKYVSHIKSIQTSIQHMTNMKGLDEFMLDQAVLWEKIKRTEESPRSGNPNNELAIIAAKYAEEMGVKRPLSYGEYYTYPEYSKASDIPYGAYDITVNKILTTWHNMGVSRQSLSSEENPLSDLQLKDIKAVDFFLYNIIGPMTQQGNTNCQLLNIEIMRDVLAIAIANPIVKFGEEVHYARELVINELNNNKQDFDTEDDENTSCLFAAVESLAGLFFGEIHIFLDKDSKSSKDLLKSYLVFREELHDAHGFRYFEFSRMTMNLHRKNNSSDNGLSFFGTWWPNTRKSPSNADLLKALYKWSGMTEGFIDVENDTSFSVRKGLMGGYTQDDIASLESLTQLPDKNPSDKINEAFKSNIGESEEEVDKANKFYLTLLSNSFHSISSNKNVSSAASDVKEFASIEQLLIFMAAGAGIFICLARLTCLFLDYFSITHGVRSLFFQTNALLTKQTSEKEKQIIRQLYLQKLEEQKTGIGKTWAWLDLMIFLVPTFAFIGTVHGIMIAFPEAGTVLEARGLIQKVTSVQDITGALGLAFVTTFWGLIIASILRIAKEILIGMERRLIDHSREYILKREFRT